jgi:hypothetical protein
MMPTQHMAKRVPECRELQQVATSADYHRIFCVAGAGTSMLRERAIATFQRTNAG